MPCCPCGGEGVCLRCVCVQLNRPCGVKDCYPSRRSGCNNQPSASPASSCHGTEDSGRRPVTTSQPKNEASRPPLPMRSSSQPLPSLRTDVLTVERTQATSRDGGSTAPMRSASGALTIKTPDPVVYPSSVAVSAHSTGSVEASSSTADSPCSAAMDAGTANNQHLSYPSFQWGDRPGPEVEGVLDTIYNEVVHWRANVFTVPLGAAGKKFVDETTRLVRAFADGDPMEAVAIQAMMVMPALLLQAPNPSASHQQRVTCLERRMQLWDAGQFEELLREGRAIQNQLKRLRQTWHFSGEEERVTHAFARNMRNGKVKAALRLLSSSDRGKVLALDEQLPCGDGRSCSVRDILKSKHPPPGEVCQEALLDGTPAETHPVIFSRLDHKAVHKAALHCQGSAGPSGLDAVSWRRMCTMFHKASKSLTSAVAGMARRIATVDIDPRYLRPLIACRLIPLSKNPGVRPIGICETLRRIIGKAIMQVIGPDVQLAVGSSQLCARQKSGCEAAVHAMSKLWSSEDVDAVMLVDAKNAFNNLNRQVMLHNIRKLCPAFATCVTNFYRSAAELFVGGETILSLEGTTQGDPLSMAVYALGTLPLISAAQPAGVTQSWFADDACGGGKLKNILSWWVILKESGPRYGYFVQPPKTWLVVKEHAYATALELFRDTGVQITTEGRPLLGAPLGTGEYVTTFVANSTAQWQAELETLSRIASVHPQEAYAAYTHGQSNKWIYLARANLVCSNHFAALESTIRGKLLPAVCGRHVGGATRDVLSLPNRLGGLGISDPSKVAAWLHKESVSVTKPLVDLILTAVSADRDRPASQSESTWESVCVAQHEAVMSARSEWRERNRAEASKLLENFPAGSNAHLAIRWAQEDGASTWLTALPITSHGFHLTRREFQDALCLRYGWEPSNLPSTCACGRKFNLEHSLSCPRGGYVYVRHNEVRDLLAELLAETCHNVTVEPELQPLHGAPMRTRGSNTADGARLDIRACGFWGSSRHEVALFDVRVFNPYAASYRATPPSRIFDNHNREKRRRYEERVREIEGGSFTPLVFSCNGVAGRTSTTFLKRLASLVATKRDITYAEAMGWLRCRLSFAFLRTSVLCLRGARPRSRAAATDLDFAASHPSVALAESRVAWRHD